MSQDKKAPAKSIGTPKKQEEQPSKTKTGAGGNPKTETGGSKSQR